MKYFRYFLLLLAFTGVMQSCVDRDYDMDNLQDESLTVLKGLEIPIGNFEEITLKDLQLSDEFSLIPLSDLSFRLHSTVTLEDMNELFTGFFNMSEAEIHMVVRNTLPFDFNITAIPMYDREYPVEGAEIEIISNGKPHVPAGTLTKPSSSELTFKLDFKEFGELNFDVLRLVIDGQTGKNIDSPVLNDRQGFKLEDVFTKCPKGVKI